MACFELAVLSLKAYLIKCLKNVTLFNLELYFWTKAGTLCDRADYIGSRPQPKQFRDVALSRRWQQRLSV